MSETDKSKLIWVVLLGLVVFCLLMAYRASGETLKGAEKLKHDSRLSFYRAFPPPPLPSTTEVSNASNTVTLTLAWDASASTNEIDHYSVGVGTASSNYPNLWTSGTNLTLTISGLSDGIRYYFAAKATDFNELTSVWSAEISWPIPPKTNSLVTIWTSLTNWPAVTLTNPVPNFFYRTLTTKLSSNRYRTVPQRSPMVNGPWETWTQYWTPVTNTVSPSVRMFSRYERL